MNKTLKLLIVSLVLLSPAWGQKNRHPLVLDHALAGTAAPSGLHQLSGEVLQPDTLVRVLAVMVDFQTDNDDRTSGDGHFDMSAYRRLIDSPPRDKAYFLDHCTFLQNYFRKASDGILRIEPVLLDSVYHLPHPMQYYSSPRTSKTNTELGTLAYDTWHLVDSLASAGYQQVDFSSYQAFVIFHAGVGRDIDLVSIYGYDPTPYDIPSIFLNLQGFAKAFGDSLYAGIPVGNGSFRITNSLIIPETESREVPTIAGTFILQLGINGLLAANFGSFLGLPDLFNTKNGRSGIGRFGLMDGQSIFSWSGIFPPEPSAWEKTYLGWVRPVTVNSGDSIYTVPAVSLGSRDTIYKVPISSGEYFLVENRNRDANRDGATVTMVQNGATITRYWRQDTTGFNSFDQDSISGSVVDIDEMDWSLPGFVDSKTGEFYDGGILIWHIDESVIYPNLAADAVNANPSRRGVNLMEADGSPDIGQTYDILSAGSGSEDGTPLDYWYRGNIAPMRKDFEVNGLTPLTHPSSLSNDGASNHIIIGCKSRDDIAGLSYRAPRMTVRIMVGDDQISPMPGFPKYLGNAVGSNSVTSSDSLHGLVIATAANRAAAGSGSGNPPEPRSVIYGWKTDGSPLFSDGDSTGEMLRVPAIAGSFTGKCAVGKIVSGSSFDVVAGGQLYRDVYPPEEGPVQNFLGAWSDRDLNTDHQMDPSFPMAGIVRAVTTPPVISDSFIVVGAERSMVYRFRTDGSFIDSTRVGNSDTARIVSLTVYQNPDVFLAVASDGSVNLLNLTCTTTSANAPLKTAYAVTGVISAPIGKQIVWASYDGTIAIGGPCFRLSGAPLSLGGPIANSPVLADIDGDGQKDIVVFSGNKIFVVNAAGGIADHFPVTVPSSKTILSSPVVADLDGDGTVDIVAVTQEGIVAAYDHTGRMVRGFPLLGGPNSGSTPAVFTAPASSGISGQMDIGLALASDDGYLYAWKTGITDSPLLPWPQYLHDARNTGLDETVKNVNVTAEFLPSSRVYNWPNPVTASDGFRTRIRYYTATDAAVTIRIFDMAGDLVTDFGGKTFSAAGGFDQEVEWDVSGIQSGLYFAHVEAKGASAGGASVIKIVVIK